MQKTCLECGNFFYVRPSHADKRDRCSKTCLSEYYKRKYKGENNPNYQNKGVKICIECGNEYKTHNKKRLYCSKSCYNNSSAALKHRKDVAGLGGRGGRVDHNQKEIVEALRKAGASVLVTSNVGKGFPDIIVGLAGKNWLIEIKNPKSSYGKTGLNKIQKDFHSTWTGRVHVIYSIDEALKLIGLI